MGLQGMAHTQEEAFRQQLTAIGVQEKALRKCRQARHVLKQSNFKEGMSVGPLLSISCFPMKYKTGKHHPLALEHSPPCAKGRIIENSRDSMASEASCPHLYAGLQQSVGEGGNQR